MKNILYLTMSILVVFGCENDINQDEPIEPSVQSTFKISQNSKIISYSGDSFTVSITSSKEWIIETKYNWIHTDIDSYNGSCDVTISVDASDERSERSGEIAFIQDTDTLRLNIIQEAKPFIDLASEILETDGDGGTFDILFLSNSEVEVTCSDEWIRLIRHSQGNIITFEVLRNMYSAREGHILICVTSDKDISRTIKIKQGERVPHPSMSFEEGSQLSVTDDEVFTLHPIFVDMTDTDLTWSSSDPEIANVDNAGNVTVYKTGQCTITASNQYHNIETSITLDIRLKAQQMTVFFGNQDMMQTPVSSRFVGEKIPVEIILTPDYAYSEDLILFSSDSEVADFEGNVLHCLKAGKTEIYVESSFNGLYYNFSVFVIDIEK